MTPDELRAAIDVFAVTQRAFAAHIDCSPGYLSNMLTGRKPIPSWVDMLVLEWLGHAPVNPPRKE